MNECPRWSLKTPHYLNVPTLPDGTDVVWEHKEQNRDTGRNVRKLFPVPMLLDPRDASDHTHKELGEIIVTQLVEGAFPDRRDIVFIGDPTPDMEPLNDAAEAISASHRLRWEHPINTLPANGGMNEAEKAFMENMMKMFGQAQANASADATVPKSEFDALKAELESIKAMLAGAANKEPAATSRRA